MKRYRVAAVAIALVVVVVGKQYYRDASAADLVWILAPTARAVSVVTGGHFVYEAGPGWVDRDIGFAIAPPCAGVNFALAAFLALVLAGLARMTTARATGVWLLASAACAYLATLVVNTTRIAIAVAMHRSTLDLGDRAQLHQVEGIVVYLAGLCALYAVARRYHHARTA